MIEILYWILFLLAALGYGLALLRLLRIRLFSSFEMIAWAIPIGLGILAVIGLELLFLQAVYPSVTWTLIAVGVVLAILFKDSLRFPKPVTEKLSLHESLMLIVLIVLILGNLSAALTPEVREDCLNYHIVFPNMYASVHGIYENQWNYLSYMPIHVESLYTLALSVGRDHLAKLIHCTFGICVAGLLYALGQRLLSRRSGLWAAFLWLITPQVALLSSSCFIDLAVSAWVFIAILSLMNAMESDSSVVRCRWLVLSGICAGFFMGAKYTTGPIFFAPLVMTWAAWHIWVRQKSAQSIWYKEALLLVVPAAVICCPILIKNFLWTGSPFYPIFGGLFGVRTESALIAHTKILGCAPPAGSLTLGGFPGWFIRRWMGLNYAGTFIHNLALLSFVSTLLLRVLTKGRSLIRIHSWTGWLVLNAIAAWFMFLISCDNLDGRFILPVLPVLCLLVGGWLWADAWHDILKNRLWVHWVLLLTIALAAVCGFVQNQRYFVLEMKESLLPVLSEDARREYYRARIRTYDICEFINENLPENAHILSIGYPVKRRAIGGACGALSPIEELLGSSKYSSDQLLQALRELGITHMVYPGAKDLDREAVRDLIRRGDLRPVYGPVSDSVLYRVAK